MAVAFTSRHPRYTIALVVILFITILYYINSDESSLGFGDRPFHPPPKGQTHPGAPPGKFTQDEIRISEAVYKEHLENRKALIKHYGPKISDIESFPTRSQFYTLWDFFIPAFQCPHRISRIGTLGDGGKWVCGMERIARKKQCVIYSVGINGESSFEADLLNRGKNCQVWGYDFSVNSFGPEIEATNLKSRGHFKPYMLSGEDKHGSSPPQYTLNTLMRENGHTFIDILKIDIEGSEFATLETLLAAYAGRPLPFGQLQLEIHARDSEYAQFPKFLEWWEKLEAAGLRPFWTEPNLVYVNIVQGVKPTLAEYSFINIRGNHELVVDDAWA